MRVTRPEVQCETTMALKERLLAQAGRAGLSIGSPGLGSRDNYERYPIRCSHVLCLCYDVQLQVGARIDAIVRLRYLMCHVVL